MLVDGAPGCVLGVVCCGMEWCGVKWNVAEQDRFFLLSWLPFIGWASLGLALFRSASWFGCRVYL